MTISPHTSPCWLLPLCKRPNHLGILTWLLAFIWAPDFVCVCSGEQSGIGKGGRGQPSA